MVPWPCVVCGKPVLGDMRWTSTLGEAEAAEVLGHAPPKERSVIELSGDRRVWVGHPGCTGVPPRQVDEELEVRLDLLRLVEEALREHQLRDRDAGPAPLPRYSVTPDAVREEIEAIFRSLARHDRFEVPARPTGFLGWLAAWRFRRGEAAARRMAERGRKAEQRERDRQAALRKRLGLSNEPGEPDDRYWNSD